MLRCKYFVEDDMLGLVSSIDKFLTENNISDVKSCSHSEKVSGCGVSVSCRAVLIYKEPEENN